MPVFVADFRGDTSSDSVEHPFCWVSVGRAVGAVLVEVVDQNVRVLADLSEVDGLASSLQQEQSVEVFEKGSVGLMDGAENGLTSSCQFAKETDDVKSTLAVKTGSRFVQEQQQLRLSSQLDSDRYSLPLFNCKACFRVTNNGVGNIFHFEQRNNFLNVGVLLRLRCFVRLSEIRGESQSFANGLGTFVDIKLFSVTGTTLEVGARGSTIDELVA